MNAQQYGPVMYALAITGKQPCSSKAFKKPKATNLTSVCYDCLAFRSHRVFSGKPKTEAAVWKPVIMSTRQTWYNGSALLSSCTWRDFRTKQMLFMDTRTATKSNTLSRTNPIFDIMEGGGKTRQGVQWISKHN